METEKVDILIIGSGPAGYTAAIYAARANMKPLLYQGIQPGGQLTITTEVENYPGFPDGIQGPEMMVNFEKQAARMGTDIRYGLATKVDFSGYPHKVWIDDEKIIEAGAVIISTGASAKWLGIPSEERLNGFGVSACAVCDGFFFKGKDVAIVGAGDTAAEDKNNKTNTMEEIPVSAFFVAIGHNPNSGIFKDYLKMDETGYILTEPGTTKTNIEGVFAAGDVQDKNYRQAVTAAGSGCMAALDAERFLTAKGH